MKQPKEPTISPEMYRIAEKIEQLPATKKKILYKLLEQFVDTVLNSYPRGQ